jgi:thiosulfate/3-mercaptopyruvate sulfurtransferase
LDGGLPLWLQFGSPVQNSFAVDFKKGNFTANYTSGLIHAYTRILNAIKDCETVILDARSYDRYLGAVPEPREGLRSGHIPNSKKFTIHFFIKWCANEI